MPAHRPPLPSAPQPTKILFDSFNSSSTGHQRAENRLSGSTSWRDSRTHKLSHQFRDVAGRGGQTHVLDLVGAGSEHFRKDGRNDNGDRERGAPGLSENGWQDIRGLMGPTRKRKIGDEQHVDQKRVRSETPTFDTNEHKAASLSNHGTEREANDTITTNDQLQTPSSPPPQPPQIFHSLTMYLNGSTAPLISDHKLKHLFSHHGGNTSIALGRRTVTHVIIGDTCGGGLASGKLQKEISTVRGKGIKFVTAQWVLDSIEKGVRQPEARYVPTLLRSRLGGSGQGSVRGMFLKTR